MQGQASYRQIPSFHSAVIPDFEAGHAANPNGSLSSETQCILTVLKTERGKSEGKRRGG